MSRVFPVYALTGPESGDKSAFLKEIRAAITKENGSEPDLHRFYPFETLNGEMFEILENNALFSDHALVILSQLENAHLPSWSTLSSSTVKSLPHHRLSFSSPVSSDLQRNLRLS